MQEADGKSGKVRLCCVQSFPDKPGKCPHCGKAMVKTASLVKKCKTCGYYSDKKLSTCPVCEARKKHKRK